MADIEYFYTAHSAFAYLGSARFLAIAAAAGRRIVHKPMDLHRVVAAGGAGPTRARSRAHRAYYFGREIERWAEWRGAPVTRGMPTHHHNDMALANGMIVAGTLQEVDMDRLAHAMLQAHWRDDADLADRATLAALALEVDLDPRPLLDAALTPAVQAQYAANTDEAVARSVFGSPTYFVDGDMFYGQDRLEMVERALDKPVARTWPE